MSNLFIDTDDRDVRFLGSLRNRVYNGVEVGGSRQPCLGTEGLKRIVLVVLCGRT